MNDERIKLGPRLSAVASAVREGITLYDVGSDHGYLPAYLLLSGKIKYAYVSDVAEGPLSKARATFQHNGLTDKATLTLSDGLKSVPIYPPCDITIAGMGGELISKIIDASDEVRSPDIRLILQPMTRQEELREYLSADGFDIVEEVTVKENKLYTVLICVYTGKSYSLTPAELLIGREGARKEDEAFFLLIEEKIKVLKIIRDGKRLGGKDDKELDGLILSLEKLLKKRLEN